MTPIMLLDKDKTFLVRQAFVIALFSNRTMSENAEGAAFALNEWMNIVPRREIKWSIMGSSASEHSPVTERTIGQCLSMLDRIKTAARKTTACKLSGPEKYNPAFRFVAVGEGNLEPDSPYNALLEITLPWEIVDSLGLEPLVQFSTKIAAKLPYDSGYLSPSLNWGKDSKRTDAGEAMIGPAMRHRGLDIHMNNATRLRLGKLGRGARWVTFLGSDLLRQLGGRENLAASVDTRVELISAGSGLALRAGKEPAIGDVNRQDDLPLLRSVARALEPVTYFNDRLLQSALFPKNAEAYQRWERRLLS
jgi:hypothetical protein